MKLSDYLPLEPGEIRILVYEYEGEHYALLESPVIALAVPQEARGAEIVFAVRQAVYSNRDMQNLIRKVKAEADKRKIKSIHNLEEYGMSD